MTLRKLARYSLAGMFVIGLHNSAWAEEAKGGNSTANAAAEQKEAIFAVVGGQVITHNQYNQAFAQAARQKFYHGSPPEDQVAALQREVGNNLINNVLLMDEAKRRGVKPNTASVQKQIDQYDKRYGSSEQWKADRERVVPELTRYLENISMLQEFEKQVRNIPTPPVEQVRAYYEGNPEKFTQPEQVHIRVILLRVDPSSPSAEWKKAEEKAKGLVAQIRAGASFAELAKAHSNEKSAEDGGDMGMLHRGTLPETAQVTLDKMKPGEISEPVILLEGVTIFKLEARQETRKRAFEDVQERATDLLERDLSEKAWRDLTAQLRVQASVQMDESRFLPLKAASGKE